MKLIIVRELKTKWDENKYPKLYFKEYDNRLPKGRNILWIMNL
jgi:hypothetical protein